MQGQYQEPRRLIDRSSLDRNLPPPPEKSYTPPAEYKPLEPPGYRSGKMGKLIQNERAGIYTGFPYTGITGEDNGMSALKGQYGGATVSYQ